MPAPITSGVLEAKVYAQIAESPAVEKRVVNVFHYAQAAPNPTLPDPSAFLTAFIQNVCQGFIALLHADYTTVEFGARWIDQTTNPEIITVLAIAGGKSGARLPAYVSTTIQLKTLLRGRSWKGSKHFSPLTEADVSKDDLVPAAAAAWKTVAASIVAPMTLSGQTLVPCILSRKNSQLVVDPVTIQAAGISTYLLNSTVGTLRKRKEKTEIA